MSDNTPLPPMPILQDFLDNAQATYPFLCYSSQIDFAERAFHAANELALEARLRLAVDTLRWYAKEVDTWRASADDQKATQALAAIGEIPEEKP